MKFQFYPADIKQCRPVGFVSLSRFLDSIKNPKPETAEIFKQIKLAEEAQDVKKKAFYKCQLYKFTPCVIVKDWRAVKNITRFTGLLVLDFDHLETDYAIEFKEYLFNEYKFIISAWLSPSKHGLKCLVKIPVAQDVAEFKSYFLAIEQLLGVYNGFDHCGINCVLDLFMSYDSDLLYREDAETWIKRFYPPEPAKIKSYIIDDKASAIEKIILNNINTITTTGHMKLRSTAYSLGGYISAGYLDENTGFNIICRMIDSNSYLSQKAETYKKTAETMIKKGLLNPLYLKE